MLNNYHNFVVDQILKRMRLTFFNIIIEILKINVSFDWCKSLYTLKIKWFISLFYNINKI